MYKYSNSTFFKEWEEEMEISLFDNQSIYIAVFSIEGTLLFANKAMEEVLISRSPNDLLNPRFSKLIHFPVTDKLIYKGYITFGQESQDDNFSLDSRVYRKNDIFLIIGTLDSNLLIAHNKSMRLLNHQIIDLQRSLIKEKFELQKTLIQLKKANDSLNEANAAKDKFFSIIAHDLKNPFSVLLGFSDLLAQNLDDYDVQNVKEMISAIHQTSYQTYQLLEDLLLWSRSQLGKLSFHPEGVSLNEACQSVFELLEPLAQQKQIHIHYDVPQKLCVVADVGMLRTILRNLLSNAIKFTPQYGTVNLSVSIDHHYVEIAVTDTGIGMNESIQSKLWSLTSSVSRCGTNGEEGTGLGLQLCKEFVEKQGGKIWVDSVENKGSRFVFTLPKCSHSEDVE
jgi:Signal transduction histidine kinase